MRQSRIVVAESCGLAEGPLWHPQQQRLYWTDIPAGKLFWCEPASGASACFYSGESPIGGFTFCDGGGLLLFRERDVCWIGVDGKVLASQAVQPPGAERFNDVIAAPDGSVFAGTIGCTAESGGLYHFKQDGSVECLFTGTGCANGMGFSPDLSVFYWTCSTARRIHAFDYSGGRVNVKSRRLFYQAPAEEGIPDGLTVDAMGNIWTARWDGWQVVKLGPDGEKLLALTAPYPRLSSVAFGGPDLTTLFTTIAAPASPERYEGPCLIAWDELDIGGRNEFVSSLRPDVPLRLEWEPA
ncbi:MAG TPA: SMP-30/gluconolactonase/LRE family protein [Chthoniobacteraceae bacterium]|jgi:D-xylonolactonase|nr:SMP-30/gluconolactonase/LRE family protein [Chthoniobacteraceae bacterium]